VQQCPLVGGGHPLRGSEKAWFPGVGFALPGRYEVYLRYLSIEPLLPFNGRGEQEYGPAVVSDSDVLLEDHTPHVLGPYDVNVVEIGKSTTASLTNEILPQLKEYSDCLRSNNDWCRGIPEKAMAEVVTRLDEEKKSIEAVSNALNLTLLTSRLVGLVDCIEPTPRQTEELLKLKSELEALRVKMAPGYVRDSCDLTLCHVLYALGDEDAGRKLATQLGTPDAIVFLSDLERVLKAKADSGEARSKSNLSE
jgi:hypothetical protein